MSCERLSKQGNDLVIAKLREIRVELSHGSEM
jgi:hypothetical protein